MHILGQMWNGKGKRERERERLVAPKVRLRSRWSRSLASLASSICLGLSESEQNPIFFSPSIPSVRRSDSRIEQWREILHSRQRAGRAPLGVGTDADGGTSGKKGALG